MKEQIGISVGPIFHLFVCLHHGFTILWSLQKRDLSKVTDQRVLDMERFAPLFFTSWNLVIQSIYFYSALYYDVLRILSIREDLQKKLMKFKGYIFSSSLFPFTVFVSATFWTIYNINRELVLPKVLDEYIPLWFNHCMHTNILIFMIIEVLIANQFLPSFKSAFIGLNVITITYHFLLVASYFLSGRWAYGVFQVLTWPERICFFLSYYLCTVFFMQLGMAIQNFKYRLLNRKYSEKRKSN